MQATHAEIGDWISQYSDEPDKVREFCVRHGILDLLRTTVELAQEHFPPIDKMTISLWKDPLEGTEKISVYATDRSSPQDARTGDWQFLLQWPQMVPLPERNLIGFSYTIA